MGKRKQKGGKNDGNVQKRHKANKTKHRRCWIESCKGNKFPQSGCTNGSLTIYISRVELTDAHTHGGEGADSNLTASRLDKTDQCENLDKSLSSVPAGDEGAEENENNENAATEIADSRIPVSNENKDSDSIRHEIPENNRIADRDIVGPKTPENEEKSNNEDDLKSNVPIGSSPSLRDRETLEEPDFSKAFIKTSLTPSAKGHLKVCI